MSLWFPKLASNRVLRQRPVNAPFALVYHEQNADRLYCLNKEATAHGLYAEMSYSDARAFYPKLISEVADPLADQRFLYALARWLRQYSPWVGVDGRDGLLLDIAGCAHLFGGEQNILDQMRARLARAGLELHIGIADTIGAAWAISHYASKDMIAPPEQTIKAIGDLPIASLRLSEKDVVSLRRLGVNTIEQMLALPRKTITHRFAPDVLERLDQTLGWQAEKIKPLGDPPHFGVRMSFPDPIGLQSDVMAALDRLLEQLTKKLKRFEYGARHLRLIIRKVDQASENADLKLARPMRDAARLLKLFERSVEKLDAGYGIDQIHLKAIDVEALPVEQIGTRTVKNDEALDDLITRIGSRIGIENIVRFQPQSSHAPERCYSITPAAWSRPVHEWPKTPPRPLSFFTPEPIEGTSQFPPSNFRWRRMMFAVEKSIGPERIAPEWWVQDDNWRKGLRDYWRVETQQGRRLWLFYTPQNPAWFVQGEFA